LIFLDASAAAKRYFPEAGSARIAELLSNPESHCSLALLPCELASALNRRLREGDISRAIYRAAREQMKKDAIAISAVRVDDELIQASLRLLDLHPLKTLDSLYLAAALNLQTVSITPVLFVSADRQLLRAARAEDLQVLDPEAA
jgi:predicted nucleic acid-binding protein